MYPEWLPAELRLNGTLAEDYDKLYEVFSRDLLGSSLVVDGYPVTIDEGKDHQDPRYERGFIHLVSSQSGPIRSLDYRRAPKLPWVKAVIENYAEPEVTSFWYAYPTEDVLFLWLSDLDFVVILKWRRTPPNTKIIVTAYYVEPGERRRYQKRFGSAKRIL